MFAVQGGRNPKSGNCLVGEMCGQGTVSRGTVRWGTFCRELAGRGTVRRETFRKSKTKYHIKIYFYKVFGVQVCLMVA